MGVILCTSGGRGDEHLAVYLWHLNWGVTPQYGVSLQVWYWRVVLYEVFCKSYFFSRLSSFHHFRRTNMTQKINPTKIMLHIFYFIISTTIRCHKLWTIVCIQTHLWLFYFNTISWELNMLLQLRIHLM